MPKYKTYTGPMRASKRRKLPRKQWNALKMRGKRGRKSHALSKVGQRYTYGKVAKKIGGSRSKSTSTLVVACPKGSSVFKNSLGDYPHNCFIKYYFSSNSLQVGGGDVLRDGWTQTALDNQANKKAFPTIGWLDRVYTPSSLAATDCSWMLLDFYNSERLWRSQPIGNSLLPFPSTTTTPVVPQENNAQWQMNTAAGLNAYKSMMVTVDRIPEPSIDPLSIHNATPADVAAIGYRIPDVVVSGFDIDLSIASASMGTQKITLKLCRAIEASPIAKMTEAYRTHLLNAPKATDGRLWETVWQESYTLPGITPFQAPKNKTLYIKKTIKCNYLRTATKVDFLKTPAAKTYGHNLIPTLSPNYTAMPVTSDVASDNNLAFVILSKLIDEQVVVKNDNFVTATVHGQVSSTTEGWHREKPVLKDLKTVVPAPHMGTPTYAKFGVSGSVMQRFRIREFVSQQHAVVDLSALNNEPMPDASYQSAADHSDVVQDVPEVEASLDDLVPLGDMVADDPNLPAASEHTDDHVFEN